MNSTRNIFAIIALLAVLAFAGCTPPQSQSGVAFTGQTAPAAVRMTLLAVDRSKSTEDIRSQLLTTAFNIGTSFDRARDSFRLYRFGNSIEEVYSNLPEDDDSFALVLAEQVKQNDPVGGTDYPRVLEVLADAAANASETEIRIVIVGDGQNDFATDPEFGKRYRAAAERLARNPKIKWIRFWGVNVGTREEIRSVFKPLGRRLQILSLDQNPLAP
jgi:hypothetical protein